MDSDIKKFGFQDFAIDLLLLKKIKGFHCAPFFFFYICPNHTLHTDIILMVDKMQKVSVFPIKYFPTHRFEYLTSLILSWILNYNMDIS